jgi:peptidoglycan/xylan/chitin deacetylase (PgdA/CDA1 family)
MRPAGTLAGIAAAVLVLLAGVLPGAAAAQAAPPSPTPPPLVVSLTFDDGNADQRASLDILARYGLAATFYVNTGSVDQPDYLTRPDLDRIAAAGNEIAGHTVSHANLEADAPDETARQICDDRATLASWGFAPVSFAYPFGAYDAAVETAVKACGYTSARRVDGLGTPGPACPDCAPAESIPPADPYALSTTTQVGPTTTLADLEQAVMAAKPDGGWVPFIFHHETCDNGCGNLSSNPALLDAFASWLAAAQRNGSLAVRTVGQVIGQPGGPVRPAPAATSTNVANGDLTAGSGTLPDCWQAGGFGTNTASYRWDPAAGGQPASGTVAVTAYSSGDAILLPRLDLGQCTPSTAPGVVTTLAARYRSTVPTQYAVYRRTTVGSWQYWTSSPWLPPAPDWAPATWTTPPAPPDTAGLAAGLTVGAVGSVTSTAYSTSPAPPPPAPPLVPPGGRGLLVLGAVVAGALGLLAAAVGLAHHQRRRRRARREGPDGGAGPPALPAPRPAPDDSTSGEAGPGEAGTEEAGTEEAGTEEAGPEVAVGAGDGAGDEAAPERGGP